MQPWNPPPSGPPPGPPPGGPVPGGPMPSWPSEPGWPPDSGWPPAGPPSFGPPAPARPSRPPKVLLAALLVLANIPIALGLVGTLVYAVSEAADVLYVIPLLILLVWPAVLGYLAVVLLSGKRWARFVTNALLLTSVPFFLLYVVLLGDDGLDNLFEGMSNTEEYVETAAFLLCALGIPFSAVPPLLLLGHDVTAYFRSERR